MASFITALLAGSQYAFGMEAAATGRERAEPIEASALLGMEVRQRDAGAAGRIDELVVDLHNARVHYAVLDLQSRRLSYPIERLQFPAAAGHARMEASAPGPVAPRSGMRLVRASALLGWKVESQPGVQVGRLTDVLVEPQSGRIPFAVLRLNASKDLRAVPLDAFAMYLLRENLVFTGDRKALISAEGFTAAELETADARFIERHARAADQLVSSAGATAQPGISESGLFQRLDRNGDGVLDDMELDRRISERRDGRALDLDRDGRISRDEFTGMREK